MILPELRDILETELLDVMGEFYNRKEQEYLAYGSVFRSAKYQGQGIHPEYLLAKCNTMNKTTMTSFEAILKTIPGASKS